MNPTSLNSMKTMRKSTYWFVYDWLNELSSSLNDTKAQDDPVSNRNYVLTMMIDKKQYSFHWFYCIDVKTTREITVINECPIKHYLRIEHLDQTMFSININKIEIFEEGNFLIFDDLWEYSLAHRILWIEIMFDRNIMMNK